MRHVYNDGGRNAAGYRGTTGDCVIRAIAIATQQPYQTVYDSISDFTRDRGEPPACKGVHRHTSRRYLADLGWQWVPTMLVGQGCRVHLRSDELPPGRIIVKLSKHLAAVIDGVLHDVCDCSRNGTRCVYGYYFRPEH